MYPNCSMAPVLRDKLILVTIISCINDIHITLRLFRRYRSIIGRSVPDVYERKTPSRIGIVSNYSASMPSTRYTKERSGKNYITPYYTYCASAHTEAGLYNNYFKIFS